MRTNTQAFYSERNYEGVRSGRVKGREALLKQVATCMLFEDTFYAAGSETAAAVAAATAAVSVDTLAEVSVLAREDFKLRHVPLFLLVQLNKRRAEAAPGLVASTIARVIQRPDEMGEFLALLVKDGKAPLKKVLTAQVKKGLAKAFTKFNAYSLAKWNRDSEIKLRDVLFLCHAKPKDSEQAHDWACLVDGVMAVPDTWETELSAGKDKKETWERLLTEGKLGDMATVMNLRNMVNAGVRPQVVVERLGKIGAGTRLLPFRFISAAKHAPSFSQEISDAMVRTLEGEATLLGDTAVLVDISPSMVDRLSGKSDMTREEAGEGLAVLLREVCERAAVFSFSDQLAPVKNWRGLPSSRPSTSPSRRTGRCCGRR